MSAPFFIETSYGMINRNNILTIQPVTHGGQPCLRIDFLEAEALILGGEEAALFLTVCPPGITIGKNEIIEQIKKFADTGNAPTNTKNSIDMEVKR